MNLIDVAYASEKVIAETSTQDTGVLGSLGLNAQLFAFQLVNFAIVAAIIWLLILKPLTKKLEERRTIIDESLDKAKEVEANLIMSNQKFQEKVDEAKVEANKIIEKAHSEAEQLSTEMKAKAKKEIEGLVENARGKIQDEKEKSVAEVRAEAANLVVAAVEKILNEKLNDKKDRELIEESLKKLSG